MSRSTTTAARAPRPLRAVVTAAAGLGLVLSGCSVMSPVTTERDYAASDGTRLVVSDTLRAENLLVLAPSADEPAVLIGALTSTGSEDTVVSLTVGSAPAVEVPVAAGETVLLGSAGTSVPLPALGVAPGATVQVTVASPTSGSATVPSVVLDGTLAEYQAEIDAASQG